MYKAFGIVSSSGRNIYVDGMQDYRPIGAFSFLGRYRVIDFPISNMTNSDIDRIQVYINNKPRSVVEHLGTGRHYNINSKRGKLITLFQESNIDNGIYNTDIAAYMENLDCFDEINSEYVVIAPSYMVYTADYSAFLKTHIESGADITLMYHSVDNAKDHFPNCQTLNINKQKGVLSMEPNLGNAKNRNIFMDTYVMKKTLFLELVQKAHKLSSMYTLADIVREECEELDVRAYPHRGFFATLTDFNSYYEANMELPRRGLITYTWGNVSGIDRESGYFVIKPSGVDYDALSPDDMVVMDLEGNKIEGRYKPSSDTATHIELYKKYEEIGGIVHTHSPEAVAWAQAGRDIPLYGTTHADYFFGPIPCARNLTPEEIEEAYEKNTGLVIIETFETRGIKPMYTPAVLCKNHGPFTWGKDAAEAVHNAVVLEEVAKMAKNTELLNPKVLPAPDCIKEKHFYRKHGANAYYGQN